MYELKVKKRDGRLETWNFDKIIASISKTGISIADSQKIANKVKEWAMDPLRASDVIDSSSIHAKVVEILNEEHSAEANLYKTYKRG